MDILEIKNVAYSYANSKEKVLSGVNQKFELGKRTADEPFAAR